MYKDRTFVATIVAVSIKKAVEDKIILLFTIIFIKNTYFCNLD